MLPSIPADGGPAGLDHLLLALDGITAVQVELSYCMRVTSSCPTVFTVPSSSRWLRVSLMNSLR